VLIWNASTKVFLCTLATDMRCGFDTLAQRVRQFLGEDPLGGHLFVFRSKRGDRLKILYWDRDGLALWYKRLEQGTFRFPTAPADSTNTSRVEVNADDLALILRGIELTDVRRQARYRKPEAS
jgi:transposase